MTKYVTIFDYIDKILIVLNATSSMSIISFTSIIGLSAGIASVWFTLIFSTTAGIIKKLLSTTIKKRKSTIKYLCWQKVNTVALKH